MVREKTDRERLDEFIEGLQRLIDDIEVNKNENMFWKDRIIFRRMSSEAEEIMRTAKYLNMLLDNRERRRERKATARWTWFLDSKTTTDKECKGFEEDLEREEMKRSQRRQERMNENYPFNLS